MNAKTCLRAEIFDQVQYLCGEFKYNDHQIHCAIKLEGRVDEKRFKQAALLSMEIVPVLSSRFVPNNRHPYWERISRQDYEQGIALVQTNDPDDEVSRFLTSRTDALTGPQIRATVVRGRQSDVLCFVVNHMVCDAAGFKEYLYLLNDIYEGLGKNASYSPILQKDGSRGLYQLFRQFGLFERVRVFLLPPASNKGELALIGGAEQYKAGPLKSFVNIFKIPPGRFAGLKQYGTLKGVTINDIVLAAYFRTVAGLLEAKGDITLNIPCTVDLRRYLTGGQAASICNLSSWIRTKLTLKIRESFDDTVVNVHRKMDTRKNNYPGLDGFGILSLLFTLLPYSMVKRLVKDGIKSPLISMTNLGIIEKDRITFGGQPCDAFMTASNKYPLYFQLSFSTYDNVITFSINLPDTSDNKALVTRFWDLFAKELPV
jgi:NRPS condensation-like uncharacterized protein